MLFLRYIYLLVFTQKAFTLGFQSLELRSDKD